MKKIKCPGCGGSSLERNTNDGTYTCQYCGTVFDPNDISYHKTTHHIYDNKADVIRAESVAKWYDNEQQFRTRAYEDEREDRKQERTLNKAGEVINNLSNSVTKTVKQSILWGTVILVAVVAIVAFLIFRIGKIRVAPSYTYRGVEYSIVYKQMEDMGFSNIETKALDDLTKSSLDRENQVASITIDGKSFHAGAWFPKKANVVLNYHSLDPKHAEDILPPLDNNMLNGQKYPEVRSQFQKSGFTNIEVQEDPRLTKDLEQYEGVVYRITIDGKESFSTNSWVAKDVRVVLLYFVMDPMHVNDVVAPGDSASLQGQNYLDVQKKFTDAGFSKIDLVAVRDTGLLKKDGTVSEVSINGRTNYTNSEGFSPDALVTIYVHASKETEKTINKSKEDATKELKNIVSMPQKASKYRDRPYEDVFDQMKALGFEQIEVQPLEDLKNRTDEANGLVKEIAINGTVDFKAKDEFEKDAKVIIRYHSVSETFIIWPYGLLNLIAEPYQEVAAKLSDLGFENIRTEPMETVFSPDNNDLGRVSEVIINGSTSYKKKDSIPIDAEIIIRYYELVPGYENWIEVTGKEKDFKGQDYSVVMAYFEELGCTDVKVIPLKDLASSSDKKNGKTDLISIEGNSDLNKGDIFRKDAEIVIQYHSVSPEALAEEEKGKEELEGKIALLRGHLSYLGKQYAEVKAELEDLGFTNIIVIADGNLGKLTAVLSGRINSITIADNGSFSKGDYFDPDAKIVIHYNSLPE